MTPAELLCRRELHALVFFDVLHDGDDVTRDHKGVDLPDVDAAQTHAIEIWHRIIEERPAGGRNSQHWNVAILDVNGTGLALVPMPTGPDGEALAMC
ncbi:DUF6894 family protein [Methylobacterium oxalidis]|uniref:DUF6894 family protein n=1 Tax=Methylobacterium oxalidis TaxID=944322 RepID=UPI0011BF2517|nr:hypothetical protein [Methylobacterium oxalidis]